ncbi:MAG: RHS repeat protein [Nitrospira sp.]
MTQESSPHLFTNATSTQHTSTVTIGYDDADRRTTVTYPNTNSITYAYNAASELTSLTYKQGATTLGDLTYTYDGTHQNRWHVCAH